MPTPIPTPEVIFDQAKFKALVHYICAAVPNPKKWGATKLNKALFYADFEAYVQRRAPITGETYVKQPYGPVPQHIQDVLADLERERLIAISEASGYNTYVGQPYQQRLFFSLTQPDLRAFSGEEISIVDHVVQAIYRRHTARSISEASHDVIWKSAELGEPIPYYTAYARLLAKPEAEDVAWAEEQLRSSAHA